MQIKGLIYCYTNILNNEKYIGQTTRTLEERAGKNGERYSHKFGNAIKKYGWENFKSEILEEHFAESKEELIKILNERESYWISFYNSVEEGYNVTKGGDASCGWTQEMKDKLSKTNKGHIISEETRRKISEANKGKKRTAEQRKKISDMSRLGIKKAKEENPDLYLNQQAQRIRSLKNVTHTAQWNKKISEASKGKKQSAENIEKRKQAHFSNNNGKYFSEETLEKMRQKSIGRIPGDAKAVKCVETGEIFPSMNRAAEHFGVKVWYIRKALTKNITINNYHLILNNDKNKKELEELYE